jgi:hypothetical protein
MALPKLSDSQIEWIIQQVRAYIEEQRQCFIRQATPIDQNAKARLGSFFSSAVLDSARVIVLASRHVPNPRFYAELTKMGFPRELLPDFGQMAASTFVETVVCHGAPTDRTLFHELVHVVQYRKLGLSAFAAKYVTGFLGGGSYEAIPLERNAYELDARFEGAPTQVFSADTEVQSWIDAGRL